MIKRGESESYGKHYKYLHMYMYTHTHIKSQSSKSESLLVSLRICVNLYAEGADLFGSHKAVQMFILQSLSKLFGGDRTCWHQS